jgi:hypothetical protein
MNPKMIALAFSTLLGACTGAGSQHAARAGAAPVACEGSSVRSDAELARYAGCTEIQGSLSIEGVTTLAPLADLHRVEGALTVRNTRRLYSLAGLEALAEVGELRIEKNVGLINAGSLNGLSLAASVVIAENPRLTKRYGLLGQLTNGSTRIRYEANAGLRAEGIVTTSEQAQSRL